MGMTIEEIIDGLQFTIDMFLFNPSTGEIQPKHLLSEDSRLTVDACEGAIDTMRKYQQLEKFARWVAVEVIDEDMWTLNHLSFAELACRKLVKLGIIQESNGEYLYEEVDNGNDD